MVGGDFAGCSNGFIGGLKVMILKFGNVSLSTMKTVAGPLEYCWMASGDSLFSRKRYDP
jgi:hypothetical protein